MPDSDLDAAGGAPSSQRRSRSWRAWVEEVGDRRAGRQDGRRGLPEVRPHGVLTPRLEEIHTAHATALAGVWQSFLDETAGLRVTVDGARRDCEQRRARVEMREERLAQVLRDGVAAGRRHGEESLTEDLVRRRRRREFDRRVAKARGALDAERSELAEAEVRLIRQEASLEEHRIRTAARGLRLHEHACDRAVRYVRSACRSHPDRQGLVRATASSGRDGRGLLPAPPVWLGTQRSAPLVPQPRSAPRVPRTSEVTS